MKKIIAIAFILTLVAAPAFAAGEYSGSITGGSETISVLSKNVTANVVSSATRFAAAAAHTSGSKQFGVTSEDTSIFAGPFEDGTTNLVAPTVSDSTSFVGTGWTTL